MKLEITYMSHRGMGGHENIYPEKHWMTFAELGAADFSQAIRTIRETGFRRAYSTGIEPDLVVYVPPTAILELKEV